jgi:hypothetical protein
MRFEGLRSYVAGRYQRADLSLIDCVRCEDADRLADNSSWQVFEWHESSHFHVANVGELSKRFSTRDIFAATMHALDNDAGERCAYISSSNLVVNLANANLCDIRIAKRKVAVCFRLFEFKFGDKVRTL